MNISSIVVLVNPEHEPGIIETIKKSDFCEFHLSSGDGRIVVTFEGDSIEEEMESLKKLKAIPGIISAEMVYSYTEDELDQERDKLEVAPEYPDWLNKDNIDARDITYKGDLKGKF